MKMPSINKFVRKEVVKEVLSKNYINFAPDYMTFLGEWITGTYNSFKDSDKYFIVSYLFRRNLEFYYKNFIKIDYDTFYKSDHIEIQKINIVEIAEYLNIPKETARRKINELEKIGVLKKKDKKLIINKSAFEVFKPTITIRNLTNVFFSIYKIFLKEKIINKEIKKEDIAIAMKKNFTFTWFHYYNFILYWLISWKKFFNNDSELFIIWGIPFINRTHRMKNDKNLEMNISKWRTEIEKIKTQGINTMSLSDITGIPRPTVTRKLKILIKKNLLTMDENKLIHPGKLGKHKNEMYRIQNNCLNSFSEFTSTICNQIILS